MLPCQREPYADPAGTEALVRTYPARSAGPPASAVQMTEASATPKAARRTYRHPGRLVRRLHRHPGPADRDPHRRAGRRPGAPAGAALLGPPGHHMVVGVSRTGLYKTTTVDSVATDDAARRRRLRRDAGRRRRGSVRPRGGRRLRHGPAPSWSSPRRFRSASAPALLSEVDLPPVSGVELPWAGTEPERASDNMAATRCDNATFTGVPGREFAHGLHPDVRHPRSRAAATSSG